jgi:hypothetical protein
VVTNGLSVSIKGMFKVFAELNIIIREK